MNDNASDVDDGLSDRKLGWYDDPPGAGNTQRFWNGKKWTESTRSGTRESENDGLPWQVYCGCLLVGLVLFVAAVAVLAYLVLTSGVSI